jgi:putative transposase
MYFVTICTHQREPILGTIDAGKFVEQTWLKLPNIFLNLKPDKFILMPNHVHATLFLATPTSSPGAPSGAPTDRNSLTRAGCGALMSRSSLAAIIRAFKSQSAIGVNKIRMTPNRPLWQRNYYEHIIRTSKSLNELRRYIHENPARWPTDEENPQRIRQAVVRAVAFSS